MIKCGDFDWKDINPDIFGSMIQAVVTPEMRAGLGMHYTSVPNIMKLIRPLFLDCLYEEFNVAKDTHDVKRLQRLRERLGKIKFFDPACGSGNFLIVSYKKVRELEILIWEELRKLGVPELPLSNINLQQFYGIEIDDFACDTATLSLWLAEHQMNNKFAEAFGIRPNALPLRPSGHIVCGNACRLGWNVVCPHTAEDEVYVMGNPPYLGARLQDESQKEDMQFTMQNSVPSNNLDYIATWFFIGSEYIKRSKSRLAFVTTNSICQGEQVGLLWSYILSLDIEIYFAYSSFKWSNNAKNNAGVTCAIVGLRNSSAYKGEPKFLFRAKDKQTVDNINPYLTNEANVFVTRQGTAISDFLPIAFGSMPNDGGAFVLTPQEKDRLTEENSRTVELIHPFLGSQEFIRGEERYCLWITDDLLPLAKSIPGVKKRIEACKATREKSPRNSTKQLASNPHKFGEIRYKDSECIIIPRVSSERREYIPIGYLPAGTVVSDSAFAIYDAPQWLFAILTSKMHMAWVKTVGGRLETRYRYSAQLCYNTFPFLTISEAQKAELANLAQDVLDLREEHFDMTLGEMYNPETMPEDLKEAHHRLDLSVERCYRPEPFTSDEERLECLFKLYAKMTKK